MTETPTTPASLTWSGVTARRMTRHALTEPAADLSPADVAGLLCGAHAQVLSAAELSIGRRIAGATRTDVQRARWAERTLVTSTAAHCGMLCFGPDRGRQVTYTNPHRWLPGFRPANGDAALRSLVQDYLHAYGPATPRHFARWLGIPPRYAGALFGTLAGDLERVMLDGEPAWTVDGDTGTPPRPHRGIRLLPYFDAYVVAGQPRDRLYPGAAATRALTPTGQAGNYPVLLIDGVVGGVWHQRRSGRMLALTVEPLRELTSSQLRQLDEEVGLVGVVMEATPTLTVGPVTVGAHA